MDMIRMIFVNFPGASVEAAIHRYLLISNDAATMLPAENENFRASSYTALRQFFHPCLPYTGINIREAAAAANDVIEKW